MCFALYKTPALWLMTAEMTLCKRKETTRTPLLLEGSEAERLLTNRRRLREGTDYSEGDLKRFLKKARLDDKGCWLWCAARFKIGGYGVFDLKGETITAHRACWLLLVGEIPGKLHVLHRCDVRHCVNPDHLFLGTHQDNMRDRDSKNRQASGERHGSKLHKDARATGVRNGAHTKPHRVPRGERHGCSVLTEKEVLEIRSLYVPWKVSCKTLSKKYGVNSAMIHAIIKRKNWKHI